MQYQHKPLSQLTGYSFLTRSSSCSAAYPFFVLPFFGPPSLMWRCVLHGLLFGTSDESATGAGVTGSRSALLLGHRIHVRLQYQHQAYRWIVRIPSPAFLELLVDQGQSSTSLSLWINSSFEISVCKFVCEIMVLNYTHIISVPSPQTSELSHHSVLCCFYFNFS